MTEPRFRMLGPLEVHDGTGWRPVGAPKWRSLLATLVLHAGQPVATEQLVAEMWGGDEPPGARNQLQGYVMRLRRAIGDPAGAVLRTKAPGYLLAVPTADLDANRFEALVDDGRTALRGGDAAGASTLLREALGLWRGPALADVPPTPLVVAATTRFAELRLAALETRIDADLASGRDGDLVAELQVLVREHALRERFWEQLMLALHRCGRRGDALAMYREVYQLLSDSLGVAPGEPLQQLHQQILRGDPTLQSTPATAPPREGPARPNCLPYAIADFTGRRTEVAEMLAAASTGKVTVWAVDGAPGTGKTTLAVQAAHQLTNAFPDGQLFVDLHGCTAGRAAVTPGAAVRHLLCQLGVPVDQIPAATAECAARWRAELAGRRIVLVLDNAVGAAQVRPLLPGASEAVVIVTSRRRLTGLEGARPLSLDGLPPADAAALFQRIAGRRDEADDVAEVVRLCGHLPLAIRLAAARLVHRPRWRVADLADRLRDEGRRLAELAGEDQSVSASFQVSYEQLTAGQQRLFRLLALVPGPDLDSWVAAAVSGLPLADARGRLEELVDSHLLEATAADRYRLHDLLRQYARRICHTAESDASRDGALRRMLDYYLATADRAGATLAPQPRPLPLDISEPPRDAPALRTREEGLAWFEAERDNLVAATELAGATGLATYAWQLPYRSWRFFDERGYVKEWLTTHQVALAAAEDCGDAVAQATTLTDLGMAYRRLGDSRNAIAHTERALALHRNNGDRFGEAATLNSLGLAHGAAGSPTTAAACFHRAHALFTALAIPAGQCDALHNLARVHARLGRLPEALDYCQRVLSLCRAVADPSCRAPVLALLAELSSATGRHDDAVGYARRALSIARDRGTRGQWGYYLRRLATSCHAAGQLAAAVQYLDQTISAFRDVGDLAGEAMACNDSADALAAAGLPRASGERRREALAAARLIGDQREETRALAALAGDRRSERVDVLRVGGGPFGEGAVADRLEEGGGVVGGVGVPVAVAEAAGAGQLEGHEVAGLDAAQREREVGGRQAAGVEGE